MGHFSKEVEEGLRAARKAAIAKASRLRVVQGEESYPILRMWRTGFALDSESAHRLRGLVDVYEAGRHLWQCLIVASEEDGDEIRFEFKRRATASGEAPLDFERPDDAPVALIGPR